MKTGSTELSLSTYLVGNRRKRGVIGRQKTFIGMCLSVWTNIDFPIRGKISFHLWKCHWDLLRGEKTFHQERQVKLALIPFTSSSAGKTGMKFRRPVNTPCNCSFLHNLLPWEYPVLGPPGPVLRTHRGLGKSDRKTPAYFSNHSTRYHFICMIVTFSSTRMWAPPGLGLCFLTIPAGTNPSWGRLSVNICALERKRWSFRDVKRRKWEPKGEMPFSARDRVEGGWVRKEGGDDGGGSREDPGRLLSAVRRESGAHSWCKAGEEDGEEAVSQPGLRTQRKFPCSTESLRERRCWNWTGREARKQESPYTQMGTSIFLCDQCWVWWIKMCEYQITHYYEHQRKTVVHFRLKAETHFYNK